MFLCPAALRLQDQSSCSFIKKEEKMKMEEEERKGNFHAWLSAFCGTKTVL